MTAYSAYVETPNGGGKDAEFATLEAAREWLRERMASGNYTSGSITDLETGNSIPPGAAQMTYRIIALGDLPAGYNAWNYVPGLDPSSAYATREEAEAALRAEYVGPDCDGVDAKFCVVDHTSDPSPIAVNVYAD